ncbi:MAG: metallophosphoesterase family protein [Planctomycetota bacterium]|jgi:DNA repair exonuclease SbcCD nuclease subunit
MEKGARILFVADTHLGFDLPQRPRVARRRRGPDFFTNFERALEPARRKEVDLVLHGGDVLFRSRVPPSLVQAAFEPLFRIADAGTPVYVVPGNHERSAIPYPLLAQHPRVFLFDRPRTFRVDGRGVSVALAGFPCERKGVRVNFTALVERTGWKAVDADVHLLCMHQVVEGAQVGPNNFTFKHQADVIRGPDLPEGFAAFLSGHIHRFQVLTHDLEGWDLAAPVFYPGSIERTSFVERLEPKGYLLLDVGPGERRGGVVRRWSFESLPARPMVDEILQAEGLSPEAMRSKLRGFFSRTDPDAVVRLRVRGRVPPETLPVLRAESLRALAPPTLNVELSFPRRPASP